MEIQKKRNTSKIKRFAASHFRQQIQESLFLSSMKQNEPPDDFIDANVDDSDYTELIPQTYQPRNIAKQFLQPTNTKVVSNLIDSINNQQQERNKIISNSIEILRNNIHGRKSRLLEQVEQNLNQKFGHLQKYMEQLRAFKIERENKINKNIIIKKQKNAKKQKNLKEFTQNSKSPKTKNIHLSGSQSNQNVNPLITKFSKENRSGISMKHSVHKNTNNPHFVDMEITVEQECTCNGMKRLPSMKLDRNALENNIFRGAQKGAYFLNQKNTFDPIFKVRLRQKNKEKTEDTIKQEMAKKFELLMCQREEQAIKLSHTQHIKMKDLAYKKKQQEYLSKFFKQPQQILINKQFQKKNPSKKKTRSDSLEINAEFESRTKKQISITNVKNYEELIKQQNLQMKSSVLKGVIKNSQQTKSFYSKIKDSKQVSFGEQRFLFKISNKAKLSQRTGRNTVRINSTFNDHV